MPVPITSFSIVHPGDKGLNTQEQARLLEPQWATEFENGAFDNAGRARSRQGFSVLTTSSSFGAYDLEQLHCWEDGTNTVVISSGNGALMYGTTTLTDITGVLTPSNDNWQFQNWIDSGGNKKIIAWQAGETPIVSTVSTVTPGDFAAITASTGTLPTGNCCHVAFGRVWATDSDGYTIKYSGLLNETQWSSGGAGSFSTLNYWPDGPDFVTAISTWDRKLVVFGQRSILIYDNGYNIGSFPTLIDTVAGVGCVARDSVQSVGTDLIFLSDSGLRSLRRTLETEKNPLQEIGPQVRDKLVSYIAGNESVIRSCYNETDGFYLLVIPDSADPVCFMYDVKSAQTKDLFGRQIFDLTNIRVSCWTGWDAKSVAYGNNSVMYGGFRDSTDSDEGVVGFYSGYLDNTSTFEFKYWSPWIDLGDHDTGVGGTFYKIPKSIVMTTVGGTGYSISVKWAFNYSEGNYTATYTIPNTTQSAAEYGESEYGEALWGYSNTTVVTRDHVQASSHGDVIRIGFSCLVNEDPIAIQRIDVFFKQGRVSR